MSEEVKKVTGFKVPTRLEYTISSGVARGRFLKAIKEGRLIGQRCPITHKVYVPPRGPSPTTGAEMTEEVELPGQGVITTFCIVNVPFPGQKMEIPFLAASILLDGADIPMLHLIGDCELSDVRMGMRVKAIWRPEDEWDYTTENIKYFTPTGEPDAPFDSYKEHL
jgi:uncharacterized OB-fold protein